MGNMKYLIIIIAILFMSCSKEEIKEESVSVPQTILNDLEGNYGTYKHSNSSLTIQVKYPDLFIYKGKSYTMETESIYIYNIRDNCDYTDMDYLREGSWVLTFWNGEYYELHVFTKI